MTSPHLALAPGMGVKAEAQRLVILQVALVIHRESTNGAERVKFVHFGAPQLIFFSIFAIFIFFSVLIIVVEGLFVFFSLVEMRR